MMSADDHGDICIHRNKWFKHIITNQAVRGSSGLSARLCELRLTIDVKALL